jgi:putative CocE/NonD family hydrolase
MSRVVVEKSVAVPMRDGTILRADVYRQDDNRPRPVLLTRTPYNKSLPLLSYLPLDPLRAAEAGYVVVIQDSRGRYSSDGIFYPFLNEAEDGYDTVEWAAVQPWADANVGMYGLSYFGATQWLAATTAPPHLKAIFPSITASDYHEGWAYQGGAFALGFNLSWTMAVLAPETLMRLTKTNPQAAEDLTALLGGVDRMHDWFRSRPLKDFPLFRLGAPYYYDWLAHADEDDYWTRWKIENMYPSINIPAYHLGGWHDIFLGGTLRNFLGMRERAKSHEAREGQKLIIGPWAHTVPYNNVVGEVDFGLSAAPLMVDLDGLHLRWFDYWLKGIKNGIMEEPPVRLFVMGENIWRSENEWPLVRTRYVHYYFHSEGQANSLHGDGMLSPEKPTNEKSDVYVYDPRNPVPTRGGGLCCWAGSVPNGAYDQRPIEERADVLVYSTPVLDSDLEVTGPITVTLFAASSAPDTDFTAKLVDVHPNGFARNLTDGIIRARYRETTQAAKLIEPHRVYEYTIDLWATSNVFKAGHRLRVEISSSNFPRFDANPNTGRACASEREGQPALQTLFHDSDRPSHIRVPIIPK